MRGPVETRVTLDTDRFRLLYWLCVGEPEPGGAVVEQVHDVQLPSFEDWLPERALAPLGSGPGWVARALEEIPLDVLLPGLHDQRDGQAVLSGIYEIHDYLDEAHRCAQAADNRDGAYWHGIMHRREPDYSNSRYWFRRVGDHPLFVPLGEAARRMIEAADVELPVAVVDEKGRWDPMGFISLCSRLNDRAFSRDEPRDKLVHLARRLQGLEMKLLLAWTVNAASGS